MRLRVLVCVVAFGLPCGAAAQETVPSAPPEAPKAEEALAPRLGRFRVGRMFLTPYFTIGTIGVDANVFFTQTERVRDVTVSGGPGLRLVVPIGRSVKVTGDGDLNYLWYAEQADQRRLMGNAVGRVDWDGPKFGLGVGTTYGRSFQRIDFEVDQRVDQTTKQLSANGRLGNSEGGVMLTPEVSVRRYEVADPPGGSFNGLSRSLSRDELRALVPVRFKLTPKTWFVLEGEYSDFGFLYDANRDGILYRVGAGFEVQSSTRLSGRVVAGPSVFKPRDKRLDSFTSPWVNAELRYAVGLRTSFESRYARTVGYSATSTGSTVAPVRTNEEVIAAWTQRLVGRFGTRLWGGVTRFETLGEATVPGTSNSVVEKRKDKIWQGGLDLTFEVAPKLTMGVGGYYTERKSNVQVFGVNGLSFGVIFNYAGPVKVAFRP